MNAQPIERHVARQAASWFLRLQAPGASERDQQACMAWRQAHADHERAWQLAERFNQQVHSIPPTLGRTALSRAATLNRRNTLKALTSLVVLGSVGIALSRTSSVSDLMADASTAVGERRQLTLSDGTEVYLNTDSAIDIRYSGSARTLVLRRGEIFISTARDNAEQVRPFSVESIHGRFQPLGTRFAVRHFDDHDQLRVLQGAVAATPDQAAESTLQIQAGQQALLTRQRVELLATPAPTLDWIDGVLRVDRMRLADFIVELGRYRRGWTRCEPQVADLLISGAFQLQDTDSALAAIALTLPVRVRYVTRYWVTLAPV